MGKSKTMMATHKSTAEDHIQKITTHHKGRGRWSPRTMHAGAHSIQGSRTSQPQKDQCPACMHACTHRRLYIAQSVVRGPTEAQGGQDGVPSSAKVLEAFVAKCVPVGVVVDEWSRHAII